MTRQKRALSIFLAVLLTVTLLPVTVFAAIPTALTTSAIEELSTFPEPPAEQHTYLQNIKQSISADVTPFSLLPLVPTAKTLNLSAKTMVELEVMSVADMLTTLSISTSVGDKVAWGYVREEYGRAYDSFLVFEPTGNVDMRPAYNNVSIYYFDVIVGKGQLDESATKYEVTAILPMTMRDINTSDIMFSVYNTGGTRTELHSSSLSYYANDPGTWIGFSYIPSSYPLTDDFEFGFKWSSYGSATFSSYTVETYLDHFTDEASITGATPVVDLWGDFSVSGGYQSALSIQPKFTLVFKDSGGDIVAIRPVTVNAYVQSASLDYRLETSSSSAWSGSLYTGSEREIGGSSAADYNILKFSFTTADGTVDNAKITSVTLGGIDVTAAATGSGHTVDRAIANRVVVVANGVTYRGIIPAVRVTPAAPPTLGSPDTYFYINGATGYTAGTNLFVMPYDHDTYYRNGYQTVLLTDASADLSTIKPTFYKSTAEIRANNDVQTNGASMPDFSSGRVPYAALASDQSTVKNYNVDFVKLDTSGAKLYVNGQGNATGGTTERLVRFDGYYGNVHDIFIANVGNSALTDLSVALSDASNIKLDNWYTVGGAGNDSLSAFTKAGAIGPSGIDSVAKIRLVSTGSEGAITGTLTISATGITPVVINLTGTAGPATINTTQAQIDAYKAVKFVPYSYVLTTDNEYDWVNVSFYQSRGSLPSGLSVRSNGEIYGIPTTVGTYRFTVTSQFSGSGGYTSSTDTKTYEITVLDNTETNVDSVNIGAYTIIDRVPANVNTTTDQVFHIEGGFAEFMDFFLDGVLMTAGVDYTVAPGSTKITIRAQTFNNAGAGNHTIAAEFRVAGDPSQDMNRTAQNLTVGRGGGTSTGGTSSGGTTTIKKENEPETDAPSTETPKRVTEIFDDIFDGEWYIDDVQWAYDYGYMVGVGDGLFAPHMAQNQATIFAVLARLADVNVYNYANNVADDIKAGEWYTNAALWAKAIGLMVGEFDPDASVSRADMAVIITRFLAWLEVELPSFDANLVITDGDALNSEQADAFKALHSIGVFRGTSKTEVRMNPEGMTSRVELSALLRRLNAYILEH